MLLRALFVSLLVLLAACLTLGDESSVELDGVGRPPQDAGSEG
jgi:hypothetical protein